MKLISRKQFMSIFYKTRKYNILGPPWAFFADKAK